jgi:hypothetical protein
MPEQTTADQPAKPSEQPDQPAKPSEQPDQPAKPSEQPNGAGQDRARKESVVVRLMRRSGAEVQDLLEALGMREQLSGEGKDLARLVEHKLAYSLPLDREEALDQLDVQRAYLTHRFIAPLKRYDRGDRFYAYLDTFLNLVSILAGVGASLAAALAAPKIYAIVFGLIVGFLQSLSQWLKPSRRSTRRGLSAAALRNEAWAFLQGRDRYRGKDEASAWTLFCDQVEEVEMREQTDEDQESRHASTAAAPS